MNKVHLAPPLQSGIIVTTRDLIEKVINPLRDNYLPPGTTLFITGSSYGIIDALLEYIKKTAELKGEKILKEAHQYVPEDYTVSCHSSLILIGWDAKHPFTLNLNQRQKWGYSTVIWTRSELSEVMDFLTTNRLKWLAEDNRLLFLHIDTEPEEGFDIWSRECIHFNDIALGGRYPKDNYVRANNT